MSWPNKALADGLAEACSALAKQMKSDHPELYAAAVTEAGEIVKRKLICAVDELSKARIAATSAAIDLELTGYTEAAGQDGLRVQRLIWEALDRLSMVQALVITDERL